MVKECPVRNSIRVNPHVQAIPEYDRLAAGPTGGPGRHPVLDVSDLEPQNFLTWFH